MNTNYEKLANRLINYSMKVQSGEHVLLHMIDIPLEMTTYLVDAVHNAGGFAHVKLESRMIAKALVKNVHADSLNVTLEHELLQMKRMNCYLAIRGSLNSYDLSDVDAELLRLKTTTLRPIVDHRVRNTKWCVCVWPTPSLSQAACMSTTAFEKFFFDACTFDYNSLNEGATSLEKLMTETDKVKIIGPGTNLEFSIKNIPAVKCIGEYNIPDGEVFTAPVKDSVNGFITFNAITTYAGQTFNDIELKFENGQIISANCVIGDVNKLNEILDADEGARYIGEFAIGINPLITKPMNDILFDEKIYGSFHFTPGACYDEAYNGNVSSVHWDMVCLQSEKTGHSGEIWFDDVLIRKNGEFVVTPLQVLNKQ